MIGLIPHPNSAEDSDTPQPWKHTFTTAHQHLHNLPLLI